MATLSNQMNRTLFFTDVPDGTLKPKNIQRKPATSISQAFANLGADLDSALFFSDLASIAKSMDCTCPQLDEGEEVQLDEGEMKEEEEDRDPNEDKKEKRMSRVQFEEEEEEDEEEKQDYYDMDDEDLVDYMSSFLDQVIDNVADGVDPVFSGAHNGMEYLAAYVKNMGGNDQEEYLRLNKAMQEAQKRRIRNRAIKMKIPTVQELHDKEEATMTVIDGETAKQRKCRGMTYGPPSVQKIKKKQEKEYQARRQAELLLAQQKAEVDATRRQELFEFMEKQDKKEEQEKKASKPRMRQKGFLERAMAMV